MRAPEQPSGWPRAMAPPETFTISGSSPSSRTQGTDCAAKASFSSTRPSPRAQAGALAAPCAWRAPGRSPSGRGPRPRPRWRPRGPGARRSSRPRSASRGHQQGGGPVVEAASCSRPSLFRPRAEGGAERRERLGGAVGPRVLVLAPRAAARRGAAAPPPGRSRRAKRPSRIARAARRWLSSAKASCSCREQPQQSATTSAVSPRPIVQRSGSRGFTKRQPEQRVGRLGRAAREAASRA